MADNPRILLVEDSPADVVLMQEAIAEAAASASVVAVDNGEDALTAVRRDRPDLVVLDLNLPRLDGIEVLRELRSDNEPAVRRTPVVMLSTSSSPRDVMRAYDAQANCFVTKPVGFDDYMREVTAVLDVWLGSVKLPGPASRSGL